MSINNQILNYLESRGISQTDLAKKTNISKQNLFRILNSDDIKVSQLIEITKALGLPPTYFFDGKEHVSNEEIEGYKKEIRKLENSNNELVKSLEMLLVTLSDLHESLKSSKEQSNKLLEAVSVLFISEDKEEAEKARQMLVQIVRFFDIEKKLPQKNIEDKSSRTKKP